MLRRDFLKECALGAAAGMVGGLAGSRWARAAAGAPSVAAAGPIARRTKPFMLGADISWVPEDEAAGAEYYDLGKRQDIFDILQKYDFNAIRLRTFVNPKALGGYAARMSEAFCDITHSLAMAKRCKAAGMRIILNAHLSDTWSSPGHQAKPAAWKDMNFNQLQNAVHDWIKSMVVALNAQGTPADMVAVGNEISDGCLFPDGRASDGAKFAALIGAGCQAVREFNPQTQIMLHHSLGRKNSAVVPWVDNFLKHGVSFDVIGMSCYAEAKPGDFKQNFDDLAVRYPHLTFAAAEYSHKKRYLNDLIFNTANEKGIGSIIWEPTRWREAIFDHDGQNAGADMGNKPHMPASPLPGTAAAVEAAEKADAAAHAGNRRQRNGGRYDTNTYILEYPAMSKAYA